MEKISLKTEDNIDISALLWNQEAFATVLLIHMMPSKKESWVALADKLAATGFNVLAIDLRGHGESGGGNYQQFAPEEHYGYFKDQAAAIAYIQEHFPHTELYVGGASIGANMSIKYMAEHPDVTKGFALSAGLDYYGVRAVDDIQNLTESQKLLLAAAEDDLRKNGLDCANMAKQLHEKSAAGVTDVHVYPTGGHGTDMFEPHPELVDAIVKFLSE